MSLNIECAIEDAKNIDQLLELALAALELDEFGQAQEAIKEAQDAIKAALVKNTLFKIAVSDLKR